jgi:hypothetical protein
MRRRLAASLHYFFAWRNKAVRRKIEATKIFAARGGVTGLAARRLAGGLGAGFPPLAKPGVDELADGLGAARKALAEAKVIDPLDQLAAHGRDDADGNFSHDAEYAAQHWCGKCAEYAVGISGVAPLVDNRLGARSGCTPALQALPNPQALAPPPN